MAKSMNAGTRRPIAVPVAVPQGMGRPVAPPMPQPPQMQAPMGQPQMQMNPAEAMARRALLVQALKKGMR